MTDVTSLRGLEVDFTNYQNGIEAYLSAIEEYDKSVHKGKERKIGSNIQIMQDLFQEMAELGYLFYYVFTANSEHMLFKFKCENREQFDDILNYVLSDKFQHNTETIIWSKNKIVTWRLNRAYLKKVELNNERDI